MEKSKVAASTKANNLAGYIAGAIRENGVAELKAVGAGALNQAVKAIATAREILAPSGIDLATVLAFLADIKMNGEARTAITLTIYAR